MTELMTTATLPLVSDYQAVLRDIREVFTTILAEKESEQLAHLPAVSVSSCLGTISERLTGALLDQLTHHVHILEMNGESYRLKHSRNNRQ